MEKTSLVNIFKKRASIILTVFLVFMLIISGPASAIKISITPDSSQVDLAKDNDIVFNINVTLQDGDAHIPMNLIRLEISGPTTKTYDFYLNGTPVGNYDEITITPIDPISEVYYGYGYGYAVGYGYFDYGYGYGYNTTYSNKITFTVKITLNNYNTGDYTATVSVIGKGEEVITKGSATFSLIKSSTSTGVPATIINIISSIQDKVELALYHIKANTPVKIDVDSIKDVGIDDMEMNVKEDKSSMKLSIEKVSSLPSTVPKPSGKVFTYLKIDVDVSDEDIDYAKIKFKVQKSWLSENNIDENTVTLLRFTNNWVELETTKIGEDGNYVYYEAITPGFSYFAIAGEEKQIKVEEEPEEPVSEEKPPKEKKIEQPPEEEPTTQPEMPVEKEKAYTKWLAILVIIIIAITAFVLAKARK